MKRAKVELTPKSFNRGMQALWDHRAGPPVVSKEVRDYLLKGINENAAAKTTINKEQD